MAVTVNAGLTILYWQIGDRIRQDILKEKRAEYGKEIVATLSRQLSWSHFKEILPLRSCFSVISTPKCASWSGAVFGHSGKKLMECFMTELPKRELLEQKLHKAVEMARKKPQVKPA